MRRPFFSVIIPTYNNSDVLPGTIRNVQQQNYSDWELIIVDDGSTDNTQQAIEPLLTDNRIHYYLKQNEGVSVARNFGASKSIGSHLVFLDSDDTPYPNWLELLLNDRCEDVNFIGYDIFRNNKLESSVVKFERHQFFNNHSGIFLAGTFTISRDLFSKIGGYDVNLPVGENFELGLRVFYFQGQALKFNYSNLQGIRINWGAPEVRMKKYVKKKAYSVMYTLSKHKQIFEQNRINKITYLHVLAFSFRKLGHFRRASLFYLYLLRYQPWNIKFGLNYLICRFRYVRSRKNSAL